MIQTEIRQILIKKSLGLTFVLSAAAFAFAQEKVSTSGTIVDKQNNPVPYASVTFSNKANKLYSDAALTDEKGNFSIQLVPGNYDIIIEAIDYKKSTQNKQISGGNLGSISIESEGSSTALKTQEIQGVTIVAQSTKPYRVELDKKVYDPSQDVLSKGGNLQDVLTNVPSVNVDTDGTVSMRGNSNVRFLINGKPSSLLGIDSGANALQSIPADQIERIEVITNPSSKFEASGTAGILNIILKKTKGRGFNGSVTGSVGYLPQTNLNTNLSWKQGNWNIFFNGGGGYSKRKNTRENETTYFDTNGNIAETLDQNNSNDSESRFYNANAGFTVDLSDKTALNMSGMIRYNEGEGDDLVNYLTRDYTANTTENSQRLSLAERSGVALQADFGIDHKFNDKGQNIYSSISIQRNDDEDYNNIRETKNGIFASRNLVDSETVNNTIIGKIDYELPIGEQSRLEAGYRFDRNENNYDYAVLGTVDDINFSTLPNFTSNTVYREMFNSFYAQFKSKINNFGYQLGLRTELSDIHVDFNSLSGTTSNINKNYIGWFPSVFLSYDLGEDKNNQLLLNYSRRISRPRSWFLIPFNSFNLNDYRNLFAGNPDLNPEYINSFELGYAYQKNKLTINPTLYYRKSQDETQMVVLRTAPNSQVLQTRPYNVGSESQMGLDLNIAADITKWWKITSNIDLFRYQSVGEFYDATLMDKPQSFEGDGFSARARLSNSFKIDKTFSMQLQGSFRGGEETASSKQLANYSLDFGASKTIWNGDGTIAFNIRDIFNSRAREFYSYGPSFERYSYMQWQPRQFSISLTYRFKQGEKIEQPKKKKDNNNNYQGDDEQGPM